MADPLITPGDIEARAGRPLTDVEQQRLAAICRDVSATIRSHTGQTISRETTTDRLLIGGLGLRLPQRPVVSITSIANMDAVALTYDWWGGDRISLLSWIPSVNGPTCGPGRGWVDVTYTHGYDEVPDDVIAVACSIALRSLAVPLDSTAIQQESIGGYSYSMGGAAAAGALGLLLGERQVLNRYRRRARTLQL